MLAILGIAVCAQAKDTYTHDVSVLPDAARTLIADNFKAQVSVVKVDKDFGRISDYEAVMTDGAEISFDRQGSWDNIETDRAGSVPATLVPQTIREYVARTQHGMRIVGIDKERHGYDVELSNGVEMRFDKTGNFLSYDD